MTQDAVSGNSGPEESRRIYVSHPHGTKTYDAITSIDMEGPLRLYRDQELVAAHNEWFYWKCIPPKPEPAPEKPKGPRYDPLPLPDRIILDSLAKDVQISAFKAEDGEWRIWGETETGGGLYATTMTEVQARLVVRALDLLRLALQEGPEVPR